jgi:hypothetical protein
VIAVSLVLGYSRFLWARFVLHQDLQTVLRCHMAAFVALGGVPRQILYDRMKSAITGEDAEGHIVYNRTLVDFARHQQPDDPDHPRLVGERHLELSEVDLRLVALRRLEAHFEDRRPQLAECIGDGGVAALIAALFGPSKEAPTGQTGPGPDSLTQVWNEWVDAPGARLARALDRRLQAAREVLAHRLAIDAKVIGDGRDRQALPMQIQDHHDLPKLDHRFVPSRSRGQHR